MKEILSDPDVQKALESGSNLREVHAKDATTGNKKSHPVQRERYGSIRRKKGTGKHLVVPYSGTEKIKAKQGIRYDYVIRPGGSGRSVPAGISPEKYVYHREQTDKALPDSKEVATYHVHQVEGTRYKGSATGVRGMSVEDAEKNEAATWGEVRLGPSGGSYDPRPAEQRRGDETVFPADRGARKLGDIHFVVQRREGAAKPTVWGLYHKRGSATHGRIKFEPKDYSD